MSQIISLLTQLHLGDFKTGETVFKVRNFQIVLPHRIQYLHLDIVGPLTRFAVQTNSIPRVK